MSAHSSPVPFQANIDLLRQFLAHREAIVENIEALLNAQRKPTRNSSLLTGDFEACLIPAAAAQKRQLEETHWTAGFRPRQVQHVHNDLIDPVEMMLRALHCWQQTRWPGRSGRIHYAHTLFNLYVLRWLQFLSLRIFDEHPASARLSEIQAVLDHLWKTSPRGQPPFVRDARWLIPLTLSLITDELAPYFEIARQVTGALPEADALEIQKAQVRMLGGHLTSQIRFYSTNNRVPINEPSVVLGMRTSNALDFALLIQGLVALLKTYDHALQTGDEPLRRDMAGAIFQGISPDPELFLNRTGLLNAYSMIEHVFITQNEYSPEGQRHIQRLKEYAALLHRLIHPLREDIQHFKPYAGGCSTYGVLFGLPSNLIEHMALKAVQHDAESRFSLEDVFRDDVAVDRDTSAAKLAWINGWRNLPHIDREVQQRFAYPQQFAEEIHERIAETLQQHDADSFPKTGKLYIDPETNSGSPIPELPARYVIGPDGQTTAAQLLAWRKEAHFLASYETPSGWVALKKELLTEILGAGLDARIVGLPPEAARVLRLMAPDLVSPTFDLESRSA